MFRKILCPIDFSDGARAALRLASRIAVAGGAELVIAHVWHVPPLAYAGQEPLPADTIQVMVEEEQRALAAAEAEARGAGVKRVSTLFLDGVPWDQITGVAADPAIDLIVIGTHGRTGVSRFLLGSVAEMVVRHAPCSVLVARGDAAEFHRVLCPIDFSDAARTAMESAAELAGDSVTLLHATELPVGMPAGPELTTALAAWAADAQKRTKASVTSTMRFGNAADQTLAALGTEPGYELCVLGSHGRTGLRRALLGSVAEKVVRHARCSVLVARQRAQGGAS